MARAPNEKAKRAYELYKRGYKLVEISKNLEVPEGTIRSWKKRYNWQNTTLQKNNENKCNVENKKKNVKNKEKDFLIDEVKEVVENDELTDKQKLFCIYFIKCFNATKAYKKAYNCKYESAMVNGSKLLRNAKVGQEIKRLKENKLNQIYLTSEDIFQKYLDIAYSDITDFIEFGKKEIELVDDEGRKGKTEITYTIVKNSNEVDGTLISEISNNSKGVKVKLQDRMKAMQWLSEHMNLATQEQKAKIKKIEAEIELLKVRKQKAQEEEW